MAQGSLSVVPESFQVLSEIFAAARFAAFRVTGSCRQGNMTTMRQPIEDRGYHYRIAEYLPHPPTG